ncbi:probable endo-1,3(4)-beta-glucanase An02g00850 [Archocentrus centrarchus]|uniref:probable endo-1,3(4)-beta-glucanase An02g00850 n=1 Tax=Archocentrus centrarchus TaxID=63155 RepID=UPI0011E9F996|nr:probable endo-1,3(4)-beta-glucanase An02g00850 [Archocentrus centrarchus]
MMIAEYLLGGSIFVLLIGDICSLPFVKGSNPSAPYSRSNTNTAANVVLSQGGPPPYPSVVVPYNAQYVRVPVQQSDLSQYAIWNLPALYTGSSVSDPTQAGGYTAGSAQTGVDVQPAAGSNIGGSSSTGNTNVALSQGGPFAYSSVVVPYNTQYGGVPLQQPGLSQYAVQSMQAPYASSSLSAPAQAGGYTAGSVQTGVPVQPAAGSNIGASSSTSNTNAAANVALSQGGPSAYSSVAVPYNTQYGGVPLQQPGLSQYAVQGLPATYASSSLSAPAQAGGSTASSTQTGGAVQPQSEINWAVPPPKLGEETSPSAQGLASSTGDSLGPVLPPLPAYQPGELSHFEKAAEAGDYQSETEELGRRTVPATMEAAAAAVAAAGGLASPVFSAQQFGMGGFWGNPYPYFDFMFLTGQYPVGTVSHFSQNYEQGRDYAHSTHYLKDQPFFYPSFDQQIVTIPGGQSLQNPSLYTSPVLRGYYQGSTQTPSLTDEVLAESQQLKFPSLN